MEFVAKLVVDGDTIAKDRYDDVAVVKCTTQEEEEEEELTNEEKKNGMKLLLEFMSSFFLYN